MSKSDTQVLDFQKICRLCLVEKRSMSSIFSKKKSDKKVPLPIRIMTCASLELYEGDGLPASICSRCLTSVNQSFAFREQCEQADSTLRQYAQQMNNETSTTSVEDDGSSSAVAQAKTSVTGEASTVDDEKVALSDTHFLATDIKLDDETNELIPVLVWEDNQSPNELLLSVNNYLEVPSLTNESLEQKSDKELSSGRKKRKQKSGCNSVKCDICEKVYKNQRVLSKHIKAIHHESVRSKCEFCGKSFKNTYVYATHIKRHYEEPQMPCTNCNKKFHTKRFLLYHMKACLNLKNLQCQHCGNRFNHSGSLRRHIQSVHTNGLSYICNVCSKQFNMLTKLKRHEIIHTSEKPFKCNYCDKAFNKFWNFRQHERLHTGSKPYKCDLCNEAFRHNVTMKQHRAKHFASGDYQLALETS